METRTQGPTNNLDTVQLTIYDDVADKTFTSLPCQVSTYTSTRHPVTGYYAPLSNGAYVNPNTSGTACSAGTVFGPSSDTDALGRTVASDDAMGTGSGTSGSGCLLSGGSYHHTTCAQYASVVANAIPGLPSGDSASYMQAISVDANLHQSASYADALGRQAYSEQFTGWGQTPGSGTTPYALTGYGYDALGRLVRITDPGGNLTTYTYDALGRLVASSDPDRGTWHYTYDVDGNLITSQGPRSAGADTFYAGYDGLDRQTWRNTSNSPTGAYVTFTYEGKAVCPSGSVTVGRVCQQSFAGASGSGLSGSYTYTYDQRGQVTNETTTVNGTQYPT